MGDERDVGYTTPHGIPRGEGHDQPTTMARKKPPLETVTETVLTIDNHPQDGRRNGSGSTSLSISRQNEYLALMMQPDNQNLWATAAGRSCGRWRGQIITPGHRLGARTGPAGVASAADLSDYVALRLPGGSCFTGEIEYHSGVLTLPPPTGHTILKRLQLAQWP
ncbi:MAG: hypothetical protein ACLU9S_08075 [Oscillospiraceae bacterium]